MNFSYKLAIFFGLVGFLLLIIKGTPVWQPLLILVGIGALILISKKR